MDKKLVELQDALVKVQRLEADLKEAKMDLEDISEKWLRDNGFTFELAVMIKRLPAKVINRL